MSGPAEFPIRVIWEAPHAGELIRFAVCEFKGRRFAQLWHFYRSGEGWKHCSKGGTMPLWGLPELHAALGAYLTENALSGALADS